MLVLGLFPACTGLALGQTVRTTEEPQISQPAPFSFGGTTVVVPRTTIFIDEASRKRRRARAAKVRISGKARVIDGDTLRIKGKVIHLHGIDAPETRQSCRAEGVRYPCGAMATAKLVGLTLGHEVQCAGRDRTRAGELLAVCSVGDRELNAVQVDAGWAIAYVRETKNYQAAEAKAKAAKSGLWRGRFVKPAQWRIKH
jgi:endonuclease YncB( thermonuclease family)